MTANSTFTLVGIGSGAVPNSNLATSDDEYTGTLTAGTQVVGGLNVLAGYDYVIAKYDGQQAGYILFYLGGEAATLPSDPYSIWGNDGQFAISNFTPFNAGGGTPVPEPSTVIAGALLLLPFAISTLRVVRNRRHS